MIGLSKLSRRPKIDTPEKFSSEYRKTIEDIHPAALNRLLIYDWPGNIRELENAIARAVIVAQGNSIEAQDLPETLRSEDDLICIDQPNGKMNSFEEQMRDFKIRLANRALMECNDRVHSCFVGNGFHSELDTTFGEQDVSCPQHANLARLFASPDSRRCRR